MLGLLLLTCAVLLLSTPAYGATPPVWSHTVDPHPPSTAPFAQPPALSFLPTLRLAATAAGGGVVQGHVYDYFGGPIADAVVTAFVPDDQGGFWRQETTTDETGAYSLSGVPATTLGRLMVWFDDGDMWYVKYVAFADPGPTTYDLRPARVTWSATRGGPWGAEWQDPYVAVAGLSAAATPVLATTPSEGASDGGAVTGRASAMPADVRFVQVSFHPNEFALWDAADAGESPVSVAAGATTALPITFDQASAYRIFFTQPHWASGRPGTVVRLAMENFPAGTEWLLSGASQGPKGVSTTWGGKSHTSTGPQRQTVSLKVPAKAAPGYHFKVCVSDTTARYEVWIVDAYEYFQVCTLNASKSSIRRGTAVKLTGVVPTEGHWGSTPGKRKYVWIYQRNTAASQPPTVWDATKKGWKLVGRVRTDRYGRYSSAWLKPTRTTWYVARYAGDRDYWRAYTSVRKVRVY